MSHVLIGTSGWHYGSWHGPFFPKGLPLKTQLQYYASQFRTTELNGVFRTPSLDAVKAWRAQTGDDFVFSWKASKFITHWKRLSPNSVNSLALIEERLRLLGAKAGPLLFQLSPNFEADAERLRAFFDLLPRKRRRYSFEFRHPSWYQPRILRLLSEHNVALCLSDHHDAPAPWKRTADFVYIRGHGPGGRYKGHYRQQMLSEWATRIRSWKRQGCDLFVYFDNDQKSAAPADALKLQHLLS